jgi:hypothetical protein
MQKCESMKQLLICLIFLGLTGQGIAQDAPASAVLYQHGARAVVKITLNEGYKTYWRMPGEAGLAPRFSWQGSQNLAEAEVHMPGPRRFDDPEGEVVGYAEQVAFLIELSPEISDAPIVAQLQLNYAVCKKLCIPVEATLTPQSAPSELIDEVAQTMPEAFSGAVVQNLGSGLEINLPFAADDIFIEQDHVLAYFRRAESLGGWRYLIPAQGGLDGLKEKTIRLTVISGSKSFVTDAIVQ